MTSDPIPPATDLHTSVAQHALAAASRHAGDELAALAHQIAAETLQARATSATPVPPTGLLQVATGYFMKGELATAQRWYEFALRLDPELAVAHQNLAAIHAQRGDLAAAQSSRERAYRLQRVFVEPVPDPVRRLLILCAGSGARNVPFETLLAGGRTTRIKYAIDFAAAQEDAQLPPFDLVFNAVGEPDVPATLVDRLAHFAAGCARPLLNAPEAVQRTRRDRLAELLRGLDGAVTAPCSRHEDVPPTRAALVERLARAGLALPVLVRPVASHGGAGLVRCATVEDLERALDRVGGPHYLTGFHAYRSADGHWRKYRVVFVDGEPWPYHLAIARQWMVHYFSAEMPGQAWKISEEQRFLDDPPAALGARGWAAVREIGRRLGLSYAGADLSVLPDGRVLVFEANATMLVHAERADGPLAYRNGSVDRILAAFERMLCKGRG